jgi:uncharacterized OB-fold protein
VTRLLEPPALTEVPEFWDGTRERRLLLPWCAACERAIWYPRTVCPGCLGTHIEWREAAGRGVVHAFSVHHRPGANRDPDAGGYVVALVELPEGVRMMTNVVGCDAGEVVVGMRVTLTWHELSDGRQLPMFEPAETDRREGAPQHGR